MPQPKKGFLVVPAGPSFLLGYKATRLIANAPSQSLKLAAMRNWMKLCCGTIPTGNFLKDPWEVLKIVLDPSIHKRYELDLPVPDYMHFFGL